MDSVRPIRAARGLAAAVFALAGAALTAAPAHAQLTPGTVKLLSRNGTAVDATTGDAYIQISPTSPAKFLIVGPAKLQADVRVNLAPGQKTAPAITIDVLGAGKPLSRFRVVPRASAAPGGWKDRTDLAPSQPVGFYMEVDPGPHAYEIRIQGAEKGAGLFLVPDAKARRPLAANAPTVPPKPPTPKPAATPAPAGTGTAVAANTSNPAGSGNAGGASTGGRSLDQLDTSGGRRVDEALARLSYEVAAKAGMLMPGEKGFALAPATGAEVRWAFGRSKSLGIGLEVTAMHFGGIAGSDPRRATPEYALNLSMVPVIAQVTWWVPGESRLRPYVAAGAGVAYTQSVVEERNRTMAETGISPGGQAMLGVQIDLAPSEFREGGQKVFLEAKSSYFALDFAAHEHDAWSATGVMAGVQLKF